MTTLFITGTAGFIGSHFCDYWLTKYSNDKIIGYDCLTPSANIKTIEYLKTKFRDNFIFIIGNICDYNFLKETLRTYKPDIVVNFCAESHNSNSIINPTKFFQTNIMGVQTLLEVCREFKISRIHLIDSDEIFGDLSLDSKDRFHEDSPLKPRGPYAASKAGGNLIAKTYYITYDLPLTISNCCNNFGGFQHPEKLIPHFIGKIITDNKLPLYKSSSNTREWIHVREHCVAIDVILNKGKLGESYNIGTGIEADVEFIADVILESFGLGQDEKIYVPDRPSLDRRYLLSSDKIYNELGWKAIMSSKSDFKNELFNTIEWYKNNLNWWLNIFNNLTVDESRW